MEHNGLIRTILPAIAAAHVAGFAKLVDFGTKLLAAIEEAVAEKEDEICHRRLKRWMKTEEMRLFPRLHRSARRRFKRKFHISMSVFVELCDNLRPWFNPGQQGTRIELEEQVEWLLLRLATPIRLETIACEYGQPVSTVQYCCQRIAQLIATHLDDNIKWFEQDEIQDHQDYFRDGYGLLDAIGAMDGTHIPVAPPGGNRDAYINRKGWSSLNVLLVGDRNRKVRAAVITHPGSCSDSRIARESGVVDRLKDTLKGKAGCLLADSGFALGDHVLTPYKKFASFDQSHADFNASHASARVVIENINGDLKNRFQALYVPLRGSVAFAPVLIYCAIILHNMCVDHGCVVPKVKQKVLKQASDYPQPPAVRYATIEGENRREYIRESLVVLKASGIFMLRDVAHATPSNLKAAEPVRKTKTKAARATVVGPTPAPATPPTPAPATPKLPTPAPAAGGSVPPINKKRAGEPLVSHPKRASASKALKFFRTLGK